MLFITYILLFKSSTERNNFAQWLKDCIGGVVDLEKPEREDVLILRPACDTIAMGREVVESWLGKTPAKIFAWAGPDGSQDTLLSSLKTFQEIERK